MCTNSFSVIRLVVTSAHSTCALFPTPRGEEGESWSAVSDCCEVENALQLDLSAGGATDGEPPLTSGDIGRTSDSYLALEEVCVTFCPAGGDSMEVLWLLLVLIPAWLSLFMLVADISTLSHDCLDRSTEVIRPGMVALRGVAMKLVCDVMKLLCDVRLLWLGDVFLGTRFGDVTAEKLVRYICPTRDTTCSRTGKQINPTSLHRTL